MKTRDKDLIKPTLNHLATQWRQNTDPDATLEAICNNQAFGPDMNLLLFIVTDSKNNDDAQACLKLLCKIAAHKNTNKEKLINALTASVKGQDLNMNIGAYITTKFNYKTNSRFVKLLSLIAQRSDINADDMQKLIGDHSQYNQKIDKSLAHGLTHWYQDAALKEYLATLVYLAQQKKIDANTIWNALRTPLGTRENIGSLIASKYQSIDCIFLLTQLCDHLHARQAETLMPQNYIKFKNYMTKEDLREHIKSLPLEQQVAACKSALSEGSALNKLFMFRRGSDDCNPNKGTLKDLAATLGMATVALSRQGIGIAASALREEPRPSAPPLSTYDSEYIALFAKEPPAEYEQKPVLNLNGLSKDELGEKLREAAIEGKNEEIVELLNGGAELDYKTDTATALRDGTPLYLAAQQGQAETVALLLQRGANPNCYRRNHMGPLAAAAYGGNVEAVKNLLKAGADCTTLSREKNSPLMFAARNGNAAAIAVLIEHMITHYSHDTLLKFMQEDLHFLKCMEVAKNGASFFALLTYISHLQEIKVDADIISKLIPATYTYEAINLKEMVVGYIKSLPLTDRIKMCDEAMNDKTILGKFMLLSRGITNAKVGHGTLGEIEKLRDEAQNITQILEKKCLNGTTQEVLSLLTIDGIDLDARSDATYTALMAAAQTGKTDVVRELLKRGANPTLGLSISRSAIISGITVYGKETQQRFNAMLDEDKNKNNFMLMPVKLAELFGHPETATLIRDHQEQLAQAAAELAQQPVAAFVPPVAQQPAFVAPYPLPSSASQQASLIPARFEAQPGLYDARPIEYQSEPLLQHASAPRSEDVAIVATAAPSQPEAAPVQTTDAVTTTIQPEVAVVTAAVTEEAQKQPEAAPVATAKTEEPAAQPQIAEPENTTPKLYPAIPEPDAESLKPVQQYIDGVRAEHPEAFMRDLLDFSQISEPAPVPAPSALELLFDIKPEVAPAPSSQPTASSTALLIDFWSDIPAVAQPAPAPVEQLISFDFINAPTVEEKESGYSAAALMELGLFASAPEVVAPPAPALTEEQKDAELIAQLDALPPAPKGITQQEETAPQKEKKTERKKAVATMGM